MNIAGAGIFDMKGGENMKKLFVRAPCNHIMDEEEENAYDARIERLAYIAEIQIKEYCEIQRNPVADIRINLSKITIFDTDFDTANTAFLTSILKEALKLFASDIAVFSNDWHISQDCRLLHAIANEFHIPTMEVQG